MSPKSNVYEGSVCFVGQPNQVLTVDGEMADAGWHYSIVTDERGDHPDKKLSLDPETGEYTFAADGDPSWAEKTPPGRMVIAAVGGNVGEPHDDESREATLRHLDDKLDRIAEEGLHDHEVADGHVLVNPQEISAMKRFIADGGAK